MFGITLYAEILAGCCDSIKSLISPQLQSQSVLEFGLFLLFMYMFVVI